MPYQKRLTRRLPRRWAKARGTGLPLSQAIVALLGSRPPLRGPLLSARLCPPVSETSEPVYKRVFPTTRLVPPSARRPEPAPLLLPFIFHFATLIRLYSVIILIVIISLAVVTHLSVPPAFT